MKFFPTFGGLYSSLYSCANILLHAQSYSLHISEMESYDRPKCEQQVPGYTVGDLSIW